MECKHCKTTDRNAEYLDDKDGNVICLDCSLDLCEHCLVGECEIETRDGEYICADCYGHAIDKAFDMLKDGD